MRFVLWLLTHTRLPHSNCRRAEHAAQRTGAVGVQSRLLRRCDPDRRVVAALCPFHAASRILRSQSAQLVFSPDALDSGVGDNRRDIVESLKRARNELDNGHVVCIFAEGAISRTGRLLPFKRGFEKIVEGHEYPDRAGAPGSTVGQHLQFQGRPIFLEMAAAHALSRHCVLRPAAAADRHRAQVRNAVLELESEAMAVPAQRERICCTPSLSKWPSGTGRRSVWPTPPERN